jgi:hypothetical protein
MGTTYHNKPIVTDGLAFYTDPANKESYPGSGTNIDSLTSTVTGSLTNDASFENVNGGCITYDGTGDCTILTVTPDELLGTNSNFSIVMWLRSDTTPNFTTPIGTFYSGKRWYFGWGNVTSNDAQYYWAGIQGSSGVYVAKNNGFQFDNTWQMLTYTWTTDGDLKVYVNSTFENENTSAPTSWGVSPYKIFLGAKGQNSNTASSGNFNGEMGPTMVYNKALSASEIMQNYNALKNRFI